MVAEVEAPEPGAPLALTMAVQALRLAGRSTTDALNAALRGLAASVDEQLAAQMRLVEESLHVEARCSPAASN